MNQILPFSGTLIGWKAHNCLNLKRDNMFIHIVDQLDPFSGEETIYFIRNYFI